MHNDYAVVLSEEAVSTVSEGRIQGKIAVCLVKDAVAEVHVSWPSALSRLVGDLPRVPSVRGSERVILDFEEEMEVLATIEDAVRSEISRLTYGAPPSFMEVEPLLTSGLSLMFMNVGVDARFSRKLADRLRWKEGDQIRLALSADGSIAVVYCDEAGAALIPSETDGGSLEVSSYLPAPVRFGEFYTDWEQPSYWISEGRIYFEMGQFASESASEDGDEDVAPVPQPRASFLDSDVFQGIAVGGLVTAAAALLSRLAGI
jgi:hypothetical protein